MSCTMNIQKQHIDFSYYNYNPKFLDKKNKNKLFLHKEK